jgi:hypothetical protein
MDVLFFISKYLVTSLVNCFTPRTSIKVLLTLILIRIENDRDMGIEGTLLETLDHCHTPFGIGFDRSSHYHTHCHTTQTHKHTNKENKRPSVSTLDDVLNI